MNDGAIANMDHYGTLYLMPVWLGEHGGVEQLPSENIALTTRITLWFAEHEKTARHMMRRMVPGIDLATQEIHRFDKDSTKDDARELLSHMLKGRDAGIISEAGMPGIADPGAVLVLEAHRMGITVTPLIGPSSLFLALAASGLNGQHFTFHGYLPRVPAERKRAIKQLEADARTGTSQLFIETPYRNDALLGDLLQHGDQGMLLTLAIDVSQGGSTVTRSIGDWAKSGVTIGKRPTVFILGGPVK